MDIVLYFNISQDNDISADIACKQLFALIGSKEWKNNKRTIVSYVGPLWAETLVNGVQELSGEQRANKQGE